MSTERLTDEEYFRELAAWQEHRIESGEPHSFCDAYGCRRVGRLLATIATLRTQLAAAQAALGVAERERDQLMAYNGELIDAHNKATVALRTRAEAAEAELAKAEERAKVADMPEPLRVGLIAIAGKLTSRGTKRSGEEQDLLDLLRRYATVLYAPDAAKARALGGGGVGEGRGQP